MKKLMLIILGLGVGFTFTQCEFSNDIDPNQPSLSGVLANTTPQELNLLMGGLEARSRDAMGGFITATGSIARELYDFNASDPTTTETLIGKNGVALNGSEPQLTGTMFARYQAVKSAEFVLEAVENVGISEAEKQGFRGVANTMKALVLLDVLSLLNSNGVRVDIADPENLGPFLSKADGFTALRGFLDDGFSQLQGAEFTFQLSGGFAGFDTPAEFALFNRAVAARVATYEEDYAAALGFVNASFMDMTDDLDIGPKRSYGQGGTEILNPIFKSPQQSGDQYIVHNRMIDDIQAGDTRINKFRLRDDPVSRDGLNGTHEISLYGTSTDPIDYIRNEELILIFAEANIQLGNFSDAADALNVIRNAYGLADYAGALNADDLTDELLYNRTYSLWAEGHAMFDLRRYNRLNDQFLPIDRLGDVIHTEFPIPLFE